MRVALGSGLALACLVVAAVNAGAAAPAEPRPSLTATSAVSGPPGSTVSYVYAWTYRQCAAASVDPASLVVVLHWDSPASAIGTAGVTVSSITNGCGGIVTGTVPAFSAPGPHHVSASLEDPGDGGARVPRSLAIAAQPFTVDGPPTPTPGPTPFVPPPLPSGAVVPTAPAVTPPTAPIPSPSPSDTPAPTDTPAISTTPPSPSASEGAGIVPTASGGSGGLSPPGGWVLDLSMAGVALAALAVTLVVAAVRSRRPAPHDPFEFLR